MKPRTILLVVLATFVWIGVGTALAKPGKAKGWPNAGITSPGHPKKHGPHNYGSPHGHGHGHP